MKANGITTVLMGAGLLTASMTANAIAFDVYTDRASWEAAVGVHTVEGFETTPAYRFEVGSTPSTATLTDFDLTVGANPFLIEIGSSGAMTGAQGFHSLVAGAGTATTYPVTANTFTFKEGIRAWAVDIGVFGTGSGLFAKIADDSFAITTANEFFGVVASGAFTQVDLVHQTFYGEEEFVLDNVSYAKAESATEVPEPATIALTLAGLAGIGAARRGRKTI